MPIDHRDIFRPELFQQQTIKYPLKARTKVFQKKFNFSGIFQFSKRSRKKLCSQNPQKLFLQFLIQGFNFDKFRPLQNYVPFYEPAFFLRF